MREKIRVSVDNFLKRHPLLVKRLLLLANRGNVKHAPYYLKIETTNACNATCVYCPREKMTREVGVMNDEFFNDIVCQASEMGIEELHLQNYGEPLLDKNICKRIRFAKEKGIKTVQIFTNGSLLVSDISKGLIDAGIDIINISIDPYESRIHNSVRQNIDLEVIEKNIEGFLKQRENKKSQKPFVFICATVKGAGSDLEWFRKKWQERVDHLVFSPVHNWADSLVSYKGSMLPCLRLWFTMTVLWNGIISMCCVDFDGRFIMGDLNRERLRDIWFGDTYKRYRLENMKLGIKEVDGILCNSCSLPDKDSLVWVKDIIIGKDVSKGKQYERKYCLSELL